MGSSDGVIIVPSPYSNPGGTYYASKYCFGTSASPTGGIDISGGLMRFTSDCGSTLIGLNANSLTLSATSNFATINADTFIGRFGAGGIRIGTSDGGENGSLRLGSIDFSISGSYTFGNRGGMSANSANVYDLGQIRLNTSTAGTLSIQTTAGADSAISKSSVFDASTEFRAGAERALSRSGGTLQIGDNANFSSVTIGNSGGLVSITQTAGAYLLGTAIGSGNAYIQGWEQSSDPSSPAANSGVIFFKDNGAGKTQACVRFNTGATQCFATEP